MFLLQSWGIYLETVRHYVLFQEEVELILFMQINLDVLHLLDRLVFGHISDCNPIKKKQSVASFWLRLELKKG